MFARDASALYPNRYLRTLSGKLQRVPGSNWPNVTDYAPEWSQGARSLPDWQTGFFTPSPEPYSPPPSPVLEAPPAEPQFIHELLTAPTIESEEETLLLPRTATELAEYREDPYAFLKRKRAQTVVTESTVPAHIPVTVEQAERTGIAVSKPEPELAPAPEAPPLELEPAPEAPPLEGSEETTEPGAAGVPEAPPFSLPPEFGLTAAPPIITAPVEKQPPTAANLSGVRLKATGGPRKTAIQTQIASPLLEARYAQIHGEEEEEEEPTEEEEELEGGAPPAPPLKPPLITPPKIVQAARPKAKLTAKAPGVKFTTEQHLAAIKGGVKLKKVKTEERKFPKEEGLGRVLAGIGARATATVEKGGQAEWETDALTRKRQRKRALPYLQFNSRHNTQRKSHYYHSMVRGYSSLVM